MPAFTGAAFHRDPLYEFLRHAAHDLLPATIVKWRDIRERETGSSEMTCSLHKTCMRARSGGSNRGDRPRSATAHYNNVKIMPPHVHTVIFRPEM